jgi:hypothetical protein
MAKEIAQCLKRLMHGLTFPDKFEEFLLVQGILTASDYATLAAEETLVKAEIIDPAKSAEVLFTKLEHKVSVTKLWVLCKDSGSKPGGSVAGASEDSMPEETVKDVKESWFKKLGFHPPDAMLLIAETQTKIWRSVTLRPARVDVFMIEKLRTLANSERPFGTQVSVVPGQAVEAQAVVVDVASKHIEIYLRVRAYFMTVAYVNIRNPTWFDYQTAIFASEQVLTLLMQTFNKLTPPVTFYIEAWGQKIHHFSEQVRVSGDSMAVVVRNTGGCLTFWNCWTSPPNQSGGGGSTSGPDIPAAVEAEIRKLREQARTWQAQSDRHRTELDQMRDNFGLHALPGRGGGAKGGKSKSGKGKGGKRPRDDHRDNRRGDRGDRSRDRDRARGHGY